jgi:hypothetical protein
LSGASTINPSIYGLTNTTTLGLSPTQQALGLSGITSDTTTAASNPLLQALTGKGSSLLGSPGLLQGLMGLYSMSQGNQYASQLNQLAQTAQTNLPAQQAAASVTANMLNNPANISSVPGYQAYMTGIQRQAAAQGMNLSPGMLEATGNASQQFYSNWLNQNNAIANGATSAAGTAANITGAAANTSSSSLASGAYGLTGLVNGIAGLSQLL